MGASVKRLTRQTASIQKELTKLAKRLGIGKSKKRKKSAAKRRKKAAPKTASSP